MKQYEAYKDSGIQWLGKIPSHWETIAMKFYFYMKGRIGWQGLKAEEFIEEGPYLVTGTDFEDGRVVWDRCYHISEERFNEAPEIHVKKGDLLITKDGTVGKLAYIDSLPEKVSLNSHLLILRPYTDSISNHFMYWALQASNFEYYTGLAQNGSIMASLSQEKIGDYKLGLPSLNEQEIIASYLDYKVGQIDGAIKEKEAMLEDLKAYRTAIISEAVTKGLDKNVEMKNSKNPLIGNIPASWKVMKTLYCLSMPITDGPHTTPELYDEGIPFISAEAISCGNGKIDFSHKRGYISQEFYEECCKKYIPQIDDIYMIKSGATTGKVAIVDTEEVFTIWSPLAVFRCDRSVMLPQYMFMLLQSPLYQSQVELGWSFGTQQNIGMRVLEKIQVPVPPIIEQQEIVDHVSAKISIVDIVIAETDKEIADLKSYKSSVISEAVTGKVDLRNWKCKTAND